MGKSDYIGGRGESIASMRLDRIWRTDADLPYFWPHFLGEKKKTFDFLVELVDTGPSTPFFFVQVKPTQKDYTKTQNPPRLRVEISEEDIRQMVAFPAPTYAIGVQERDARAARSSSTTRRRIASS